MKKFVLAMFVVLMMAGAANANLIGIFGDMDGAICSAPVMPYAPVNMYVLAVMTDIEVLTAAEFLADGYPDNPGYPVGQIGIEYTTGLVIGAINGDEGVALAYDTPQPGPIVHLATIEVLDFGGYNFDNHWICITNTPANNAPVIVDGDYMINEVAGWCFILNCTVGDCTCDVPTEASNFSSIKALY